MKQNIGYKTHKLFCSLWILMVSMNANAYQYDVALAVENIAARDELHRYSFLLTAYEDDMDNESSFYAEQAFLERISSIKFIFRQVNYDDADNDLYDSKSHGAGVAINVMDKKLPISLDVGYYHEQDSSDAGAAVYADTHLRRYWLDVGMFVQQQALVYAVLGYTEWESLAYKDEHLEMGMGAKFVYQQLNTELKFLNIDYDEDEQKRTNNQYSLAMDYYINPRTSVGIALETNRGDMLTYESDTLTLNANSFITRSTYVGIEHSRYDMKLAAASMVKYWYVTAGFRW